MARLTKSALLVDYDSLHRSLSSAGGEAASRLAARAADWGAALEAGELLRPGGTKRTIAIRRCYADPAVLGNGREQLAAAGFTVVDCPPVANGTRGVDISIAVDAMEQLADPAVCDEFIVLSAEPTVAPLLIRLKKNGRKTVIYADAATAPDHRALADAVIDAAALAEFLLTRDAPAATPAVSTLERSEIEAFARKIHAATNIPLFSPKTFAELFHYLAEEVATNGYHFQTTAKNVANRLIESGRSVTRRQIVFVVKGLALKGHVFSTIDTPRGLAEVFREQSRYLIDNAGLSLDEKQERLLAAWLVDRVSTTAPAMAAMPAEPSTRPPTARPPTTRPPTTTPPQSEPARSTGEARRRKAISPATQPPTRTSVSPAPASPARQRPGQAVKTAGTQPAAKPTPVTRPPSLSPSEAKARVAAAIQPKQRSRPAAADKPPAQPSPTAGSTASSSSDKSESIENSILAAIAEAVDVLVEGTGATSRLTPEPPPPPPPSPPADEQPAAEPAESAPEQQIAPPRPEPEPRADDDDIGSEIQKIIANYNRDRRARPSKK